MGLSFLPKTHLFFSCGKDGAVKQWDADNFSHVTTLSPAHHGEVWSVICDPSGWYMQLFMPSSVAIMTTRCNKKKQS